MGRNFKKAITGACCIFTALVFIFYLFGYYASEAKQPAMTANMITALFIAAFAFSISSLILNVKQLPAFAAYAIHCVLCVTTVFLLYVNVLGNGTTSAGKMVCIVLSLVAYAIIMAIRAIIKSAAEKRKDK